MPTPLEPEYQKAVDLISKFDSTLPLVGVIDVTDIDAEPSLTLTTNYEEAAASADQVTGGGAHYKERKGKEARASPPALRQPGESAGVAFGSNIALIETELGGAFGSVKKEIEEMIGSIQFPRGKSVLESLSLQDQVAELERISVGLDERAFNAEQMRIVQHEVQTLARAVKGQRQATTDDAALLEMRSRRLAEVQQKLALMS